MSALLFTTGNSPSTSLMKLTWISFQIPSVLSKTAPPTPPSSITLGPRDGPSTPNLLTICSQSIKANPAIAEHLNSSGEFTSKILPAFLWSKARITPPRRTSIWANREYSRQIEAFSWILLLRSRMLGFPFRQTGQEWDKNCLYIQIETRARDLGWERTQNAR